MLILPLQYETALARYSDGRNMTILLCLCRSWYAKATKDQSFAAMNTALRYAQMVRAQKLRWKFHDSQLSLSIGLSHSTERQGNNL